MISLEEENNGIKLKDPVELDSDEKKYGIKGMAEEAEHRIAEENGNKRPMYDKERIRN